MDEAAVVTCFLRNRGEVLLVRRPADAVTYPDRWGAVTGYVEDGGPADTARAEVREETGRRGDPLVATGEPFLVRDEFLGQTWQVHPFLFEATDRDIDPNDEFADVDWTHPTAILRRETVPDLWRSYAAVAPSPASIARDREQGSASLSIRALEALRDAAGEAAATGEDMGPVVETAEALLAARPSMAALENRVNRAMAGAGSPTAVERAAIQGIERAIEADSAAARRAADLLEGRAVLTLSRSGTVLEAIQAGTDTAVVAESRPAREGVGGAESLAAAGLDVTLCPDAAVPWALAERDIDAVVVGADAVLPDGRVVNKTGTRAAALAAAREGVPCHVVAARDKVRADEVLHLEAGDPAAVYDGQAAIEGWNPTFDVTPAGLVTGVVTERGVLDPGEVGAIAEQHRRLSGWREPEPVDE